MVESKDDGSRIERGAGIAGDMGSQKALQKCDDEELRRQREEMVARQIAARDIHDPRVLSAMRAIPRHRFVPPERIGEAYADTALPIGYGQTISQPFIVADMLAELALTGDEKVLEVGAGSGYAAALLGQLARQVIAIERIPALAERARRTLADLGITNVEIRCGDGTRGAPEDAPFDAILVSAGGRKVPKALIEQLAPGGRMVIPIGDPFLGQHLTRIVKDAKTGRLHEEVREAVRFVPLIGDDDDLA